MMGSYEGPPSRPERVEVITSVQRRRRWSAEGKVRIVEETYLPGNSVSLITLNFTKMDVKYTPFDDSHAPQSPMIASYDLATTKAA